MKKNIYRKLKMFAIISFRGLLLQVFIVNLLFGMASTEAQKLDKIKISISITKVTLREALNTIEQKSNLNFFYDSKSIPLDEKVSLSFEETTVEEVLTKLAQDFELSFSQVNNVIIIKKINIQKDNPDKNAKGGIRGQVKGSDTKSALPYAVVMVEGTNNGTTTDMDGNYILRNIESGKQQITISYVGYKTKTIDITIKPDKIIETNIVLEITSVEGQEVVVTAQRAGQQNAINEQLKSNVIANVVAPDRLQENPDANAAEAIGRLPGISLLRSGGEGTGVVIRGLDPKYSRVTLDGLELPSTDGNTRSTSISGISQYVLQGVEVFKAITPDMEGNSVGGTINLKLVEAPVGLKYSLMGQGGYNDLNKYWGNYKFQGDISNRFFDNKLGAMVSLNSERVNRSSQTLSADYQIKENASNGQLAKLYATNINLNDQKRINEKTAGTLILDYKASASSKFSLYSFYSHSSQEYTQVSKSYGASDGSINYNINDVPKNNTEMFVSSFKGEHELSFMDLDYGAAFSQSHTYIPDSRNFQFQYEGSGLSSYGKESVQSLPLSQILALAQDGLSDATLTKFQLYNLSRTADDLIEKHIDVYLNSKIPFQLEKSISGYIKFGGKYKENNRDRNYDSRGSLITLVPNFGKYVNPYLSWTGVSDVGGLSMVGLSDHTVSNFLKGQYNFGWYPNVGRLNQLFDWWTNYSNYYTYVDPADMPAGFSSGKLGYKPDWPTIKSNTQKLTERYYAGYIMSEIDLGDKFMILPGVRYEKVTDDLNGWWQETVSYIDFIHAPGYATTATHKDDYFLPMVHFKYKPTGWLQTLFSYTKSLNRPDFNQLIPNVYMNRGTGTQSYSAGNPDLKPELWTNYDLQVACFGNEIGLISVGGFYKTVKDMIWQPTIYHLSGDAWPFGAGKYFTDNATVNISVPQNHNYEVHLKGAEFEVQTNLWYLPEPFNYVSLNANLTLVSSDTKYDYSYVTTYADKWDTKGRPIHYTTFKTDSVYSNSMLNQPKQIANFSFGYNYKGFNMWLSFQYTGEMITQETNQIEFEKHKMSFSRWDLQLAQKLPVPGLEVLFNYANVNNPLESQNYLADSRYTYLESYGWTMDLGVRYRFSSN